MDQMERTITNTREVLSVDCITTDTSHIPHIEYNVCTGRFEESIKIETFEREIRMKKVILVAIIFLMLAGCADSVTFEQALTIEPVGFWHGLWHGIISPIAWIISLFDKDVAIYAICNNGGEY